MNAGAENGQPVFDIDLTEDFEHLELAPIVEAVIHWVARIGKPLPADEFRKQLTERLPDYPVCQLQHELQLEAQFGLDGSSTQIRRDNWSGFRLTSADKLQIAQFNRDGLVFSRLVPYKDWQSFSDEGTRLWKVFVELAEPSEIQRLGVRFINRIMLAEVADVERYLRRPPSCLQSLGLPLDGFLQQFIHEVTGHPLKIRVLETVQQPPPPASAGFGLILDLDVFTTQAIPCEPKTVADYLAKMRWLKDKTFFNLLKKKAIRSFRRLKK